jgi:hypothetical protein
MTLLVVHLIRAQNGPRPLERFLDSYRSHSPGADHVLLLALKGFATEASVARCLAAVRSHDLEAEHIELPDEGLDLTVYGRVIAAVSAERYCFVNSYSRILADDWLGALNRALDAPAVELAGATGSWASHQDYRRYHLGLPSGYDRVFADREHTRLGFLALTRQRNPSKRDFGPVAFKLAAAADMLRDRGAFTPFPSPHLRTNGFIVGAETAQRLGLAQVRSKRDAYRLESGPGSITSHVAHEGGRVVIVDRAGVLHDVQEWNRSSTFWAGEQESLLVADNQTDDYEAATDEVRGLLSGLAWGSTGQSSASSARDEA